MLILLVQGPHFENNYYKVNFPKWVELEEVDGQFSDQEIKLS